MSYDRKITSASCPICGAFCNLRDIGGNIYRARNFIGDILIDCERCGDFLCTTELADDWPAIIHEKPFWKSLASHIILSLQRAGSKRVRVDTDRLLEMLNGRSLATVSQAADDMVRYIGDELRNEPGKVTEIGWRRFASILSLNDEDDVFFVTESLTRRGALSLNPPAYIGMQQEPALSGGGILRSKDGNHTNS